jgi:acetyl-CoA C-acetyltransferase
MTKAVLIGVAQEIRRPESVDQFCHPFDFMARVIRSAAEDAGSDQLLSAADSLHIVNMFSWTPKDAPRGVAEKLGISPKTQEYTAIGGNSPQWLVNRVADNMAQGKTEVAILAGCEVMHSLRLAGKAGVDLGAFAESVEIPMVGIQKDGTLPVEMDHQADLPIRIYPILETALRAKEHRSVEEHRLRLGQWGESCSKVACSNPYAWFPIERSADEVITPTPRNRMLGYPYTRQLNSELYVDQAAAVILATPAAARRLGVPESKWVYLHGGQDAHDHWFVSHRPDLSTSPAIKACVEASLAQAQRRLDEVSFFDFYSCFPVMPFLAQHMLGMADEDPRPRTLTGGLPFFGGPGNNYVMHAIAEAVVRCRANPTQMGMVTANGYYATKHGVGLYSCVEPRSDWTRTPPSTFQDSLELGPEMEIDLQPSGSFRVEGYTIWHDRQGEPEFSILVGRTEAGKRAWGTTARDGDLSRAMMKEEWVGKVGKVTGRLGSANLVDFA